ncbi:Endothelin-converting enzyme 2 [Borealophlyctis nickersoniae]|nr:Endothelin-converting enzyme 2 [Borealophlyctis nickersoniae]
MLGSLNTSADPCEDFYEYSCGNWEKQQKRTPPDEHIFDYMGRVNADIVKDAFTRPYEQDPSLSPMDNFINRQNFEKAQVIYSNCMDESRIQAETTAPLVSQLRLISSLFPLDTLKLPMVLAKAHAEIGAALFSVNVEIGFSLKVEIEDHNIEKHFVHVQPAVRVNNASDATQVAAMEKTIGDLFTKIMPDVMGGVGLNWTQKGRDVARLEVALSKLNESPNVQTKSLLNLQRLQTLSPAFDWKAYFTYLLPPHSFPNIVNNTMPVVVINTDYFANVSQLLRNTTTETLQNYILWKYIANLLDTFGEPPEEVPSVPSDPTARSSVCLRKMDQTIHHLYARYFLVRAWDDACRTTITGMLELVRKTMIDSFTRLGWMDEPTRAAATKKAQAIVANIGFEPELMRPSAVADEFRGLEVGRGDSYLEMAVKMQTWKAYRKFGYLLKPMARNRFRDEEIIHAANAAYIGRLNMVEIPAGILQWPFFHSRHPRYVNYGASGLTFGHELMHGFDNSGRNYDEIGRERDWWSKAATEEFEKRAMCFVEQYGNYTIELDGQKNTLDGLLTLGENLADFGGLLRSYDAYRADLASPGGEERNPMLAKMNGKFTRDQLFYISMAQSRCAVKDGLIDFG